MTEPYLIVTTPDTLGTILQADQENRSAQMIDKIRDNLFKSIRKSYSHPETTRPAMLQHTVTSLRHMPPGMVVFAAAPQPASIAGQISGQFLGNA